MDGQKWLKKWLILGNIGLIVYWYKKIDTKLPNDIKYYHCFSKIPKNWSFFKELLVFKKTCSIWNIIFSHYCCGDHQTLVFILIGLSLLSEFAFALLLDFFLLLKNYSFSRHLFKKTVLNIFSFICAQNCSIGGFKISWAK